MVLDFTTKEEIKKVKRYFSPTGHKVLISFTDKEVIDWNTLRKKLGFQLVDKNNLTY